MRKVSWWEWSGIAVCAVLFVLIRLPLLTQPGLLLGWNSDAALFGLMAEAIAAGDPPLFFWGQDYMAPLTSWFAAGVGVVLGDVDPLALRVGVAIEVFAALLFFHFALRRIVGPAAALLALLLLAAAPSFFFKMTYAPLGAEQYFFVGAIAFWYVARTRFTRLRHWLILGAMAGLGWWIHRGAMFVIVPALAVILYHDRPARRDAVAGLMAFGLGAMAGALPILFGRLSVDQRLYTPVEASWSVAHVARRVAETFSHDLRVLVGAEASAVVALLILAAFVIAAVRIPRTREFHLAAGVVLISLAFWIFSTTAYKGALRYLMIVVPILYAGVAWLIVRMRMPGIAVAVLLAAFLFHGRISEARAVAAGRGEQHEQWPGAFDPRPTLRALQANGHRVCYADFWVAYKLEWLSDRQTRFIPYRSVNRTITESLRLAALPGPKCFVGLDGTVRTLTADEAMRMRRDTLRLAADR